MQFDEGNDLRLNLEDREDLLMYLKMRFANICPKKGLKFFGIPSAKLNEFKGGNGFDNEPDAKYRLKDLEIETQEEYDQSKGNFTGYGSTETT